MGSSQDIPPLLDSEVKELREMGFPSPEFKFYSSDFAPGGARIKGRINGWVLTPNPSNIGGIALFMAEGMRVWIALHGQTQWEDVEKWIDAGQYHLDPTSAMVDFRLGDKR